MAALVNLGKILANTIHFTKFPSFPLARILCYAYMHIRNTDMLFWPSVFSLCKLSVPLWLWWWYNDYHNFIFMCSHQLYFALLKIIAQEKYFLSLKFLPYIVTCLYASLISILYTWKALWLHSLNIVET